jgi:HSP20 family protein
MLTLAKKNGNTNSFVPSIWNDLFEREFFPTPKLEDFSMPAVNVRETEDSHIMELAVPGMKKSDFKIELDNDTLIISAEKKNEQEENEKGYTRKEFNYSSFRRSFSLPNTVESDKIDASYKDGLLTITIPKKEEAKQKPARLIKIS